MPTIKAHNVTVRPGFHDDFTVRCSCGWMSEDEHESKVAAQGAGDRHIGRTIGL